MNRTRLALVLVLTLVGCGGNTEAPTPVDPPSTPGDPPQTPETPPPATPGPAASFSDPSFELKSELPATVRVGEEAVVSVLLTPRGEFHVNQEFPMTVAVQGTPANLAFAKNTLCGHGTLGADMPEPCEGGSSEAAEFSPQRARFELRVTPRSDGAQRFEAKVDFAVCTDANCMPDTRTLVVELTVAPPPDILQQVGTTPPTDTPPPTPRSEAESHNEGNVDLNEIGVTSSLARAATAQGA